jgi:MoxR-like ATPase
MPAIEMTAQVIPMKRIENVVTDLESEDLVPKAYKNYVPFGNYDDLLQVIASKLFYPVFITGHSGNGKTMSVEQVCAKLGRKFVCVSMTPETDESDLLGNFVLIDGQMVWRDGPVTVAARQGAVLCIDEVDYGAQNLAALQRVLEGKPFLLKKKNEVVTPAEGFTIVATANTKGKGSEDGRYMFTNVLNEAFLERFPMTMEQDWAPPSVEKKIIRKELESVNRADDTFADNLVTWAEAIRRTFDDGGCDEVISTRRLVHIAKAYGIFGNRVKAINFCLNRFDTDTKISFVDLYSKIDAGVNITNTTTEQTETVKVTSEEIPF